MSVSVECYKLASRRYLHQMIYCSFDGFEDCCKKCWCCLRRDIIRKELDKKGFESFNSDVNFWKIVDTLNCFTIYPLDKEVEAISSEKKQLQPNKFSFSKKKIKNKKNDKFIIKRNEIKT